MTTPAARVCPDCGGDQVAFVPRGWADLANAADQYFRCLHCGRVTYEIVSRTAREIRAGRITPGRTVREAGHFYVVRRVLKVGVNEYLVYLRPSADPTRAAPRR